MGDDLTMLQNGVLRLGVVSFGAEMQSLRLANGDELLWQGAPEFWTGRAPVLFPIVGRAADDVIAVDDHTAPMPQHGFARRSMFELVEADEVMCHHRLRDSAQSREVYPFAFSLDVTHRLVANRLEVTAQVSNNSDAPMPFGFGFHPAFNWPLPRAQGLAHHVTLAEGGTPERVEIEDGLLRRTPVKGPFVEGDLEIREALFKDGALVFPNGAEALRYGPRAGLALAFEFTNLPDLALWKPKDAPFLCIEPWHGTASYVGDGPQIAQRPNSITLAAGEVATFGYSVTVLS